MFLGFVAAFSTSLRWMATMTKFEITIAYSFMSLVQVLMFLCAALFLGKTITLAEIFGLVFVFFGSIVVVKY